MHKGILSFLILILIPVVLVVAVLMGGGVEQEVAEESESVANVTPTPVPFTQYERVNLPRKDEYFVYLVGDSMTHALGPRGGRFNQYLSEAYPGVFFQIFNYSKGNQSVLQLVEQLQQPITAAEDLHLEPVVEGNPDLIIIESFGYNPLSQYGEEEGVIKADEKLTEAMTLLTNHFPYTEIVFLATVAPDVETFGRNVLLTEDEAREEQARERMLYIENHIEYANEHDIPLINVYEASLASDGDGDPRYVSPDDNIHPSIDGLELIAREMVKEIEEMEIFPK